MKIRRTPLLTLSLICALSFICHPGISFADGDGGGALGSTEASGAEPLPPPSSSIGWSINPAKFAGNIYNAAAQARAERLEKIDGTFMPGDIDDGKVHFGVPLRARNGEAEILLHDSKQWVAVEPISQNQLDMERGMWVNDHMNYARDNYLDFDADPKRFAEETGIGGEKYWTQVITSLKEQDGLDLGTTETFSSRATGYDNAELGKPAAPLKSFRDNGLAPGNTKIGDYSDELKNPDNGTGTKFSHYSDELKNPGNGSGTKFSDYSDELKNPENGTGTAVGSYSDEIGDYSDELKNPANGTNTKFSDYSDELKNPGNGTNTKFSAYSDELKNPNNGSSQAGNVKHPGPGEPTAPAPARPGNTDTSGTANPPPPQLRPGEPMVPAPARPGPPGHSTTPQPNNPLPPHMRPGEPTVPASAPTVPAAPTSEPWVFTPEYMPGESVFEGTSDAFTVATGSNPDPEEWVFLPEYSPAESVFEGSSGWARSSKNEMDPRTAFEEAHFKREAAKARYKVLEKAGIEIMDPDMQKAIADLEAAESAYDEAKKKAEAFAARLNQDTGLAPLGAIAPEEEPPAEREDDSIPFKNAVDPFGDLDPFGNATNLFGFAGGAGDTPLVHTAGYGPSSPLGRDLEDHT